MIRSISELTSVRALLAMLNPGDCLSDVHSHGKVRELGFVGVGGDGDCGFRTYSDLADGFLLSVVGVHGGRRLGVPGGVWFD